VPSLVLFEPVASEKIIYADDGLKVVIMKFGRSPFSAPHLEIFFRTQ